MTSFNRFSVLALGGLVALGLSGAAWAQEFRDSRTGKVWTPDLVEESIAESDPGAPVNRAFDPRAQGAMVPGIVVQHPHGKLLGTVPFTAGPSVPIVDVDAPSLQAIPAKHWLAVLYVTNNSAGTVNVVIDCHFTNGGAKVEDTRVIVPPAGPGERLGIPVRGPQTDLFVDRVSCGVVTPS
jgi:hypothetical protein